MLRQLPKSWPFVTFASARELFQRRLLGTQTETWEAFPDSLHHETRVYGVPSRAQLYQIGAHPSLNGTIQIPQDTVFRHYTSNEALESILKSKSLIAGPKPYIPGAGANGLRHVDLLGVFFTLPHFGFEHVGVATHNQTFVDFKLASGTEYLSLSGEDQKFLLIPGSPAPYAWYRSAYEFWVSAGKPDSEEANRQRLQNLDSPDWRRLNSKNIEMFSELFASGGFPEPLRVSIDVMGFRKV